MDRKSFIARLIAVPSALLGIKALAAEEGKPVFNVKRIQDRLDFLRKYPEYPFDLPDVNQNLLRKYPRTYAESYYDFKDRDGNTWRVHRGMEETAERFVLDDETRKILGT